MKDTDDVSRVAFFVLFVCLTAAIAAVPTEAQNTALSRFEGSVEKGVYEVDYGSIAYTRVAEIEPRVARVTASVRSKP